MSHDCQHGSCSTGSSSHSHEHENHHHHGCCHHHCDSQDHEHHHKFSDDLYELADEAWMELLKEKIKEKIQKNNGEHLNQLAQIVAESNQKRWSEKMAERRIKDEFEVQLKNLFNNSSSHK